MTTINSVDLVKSKIRDIMDFPVKGIVFKDITTVLRDKDGFKAIIDFMKDKFADKLGAEKVVEGHAVTRV